MVASISREEELQGEHVNRVLEFAGNVALEDTYKTGLGFIAGNSKEPEAAKQLRIYIGQFIDAVAKPKYEPGAWAERTYGPAQMAALEDAEKN